MDIVLETLCVNEKSKCRCVCVFNIQYNVVLIQHVFDHRMVIDIACSNTRHIANVGYFIVR